MKTNKYQSIYNYSEKIDGVTVHFLKVVDATGWWAEIKNNVYGTWVYEKDFYQLSTLAIIKLKWKAIMLSKKGKDEIKTIFNKDTTDVTFSELRKNAKRTINEVNNYGEDGQNNSLLPNKYKKI